MGRTELIGLMLLFSTGCRSGIDCGAYVFDDVTQTCRCPAGTVELPGGGGCVEGDAGGADAGADTGAHDAMTDTSEHDGGPSCTAEACNGEDDDCDGLIDEGVLTVGEAVPVTTVSTFRGGRMVPLTSGFGVLTHSVAMPSNFSWFRIGHDGEPLGTGIGLGADTAHDNPTPFDLFSNGPDAIALFSNTLVQPAELFGFDTATGARTVASTPFSILPSGSRSEGRGLAQVVSVAGGRATVFAPEGDAVPSYFIRRWRIDLTADPPRVIDSVDATPAGGSVLGWAALSTTTADYLAYRGTDGSVVLAAGPPGDAAGEFHDLGVVAGPTDGAPLYVALAIRDVTGPISEDNPLAVAWLRGGESTMFVEVTNTVAFAAGAAIALGESTGAGYSLLAPHWIDMIPSSEAAGSNGHWLLASVETDPSDPSGTGPGEVQVREIVGNGATVRRLSVPGEAFATRSDVDLATSGGTIRLVEGGNELGVITRAIGCE